MKISTKGRYALRVMVDMAMEDPDKNIKVKDIAARQGISEKYLEQIIGILNRGGLVRSIRGAHGGYRLTKAPEEYSLEEVLHLTEGNLAPVTCLEDEENQCERASSCPTLWVWEDLYSMIQDYLQTTTIKDLVDKAKK